MRWRGWNQKQSGPGASRQGPGCLSALPETFLFATGQEVGSRHSRPRFRSRRSSGLRSGPRIDSGHSIPNLRSSISLGAIYSDSRIMINNIDTNIAWTPLGKQLAGGSLSDAALMRASGATPDFAILPWVNI